MPDKAPSEFVIQCHRGAGELSTDNTLEAFELGWSLGAIPEADLRTTRDGVCVAFHDDTFQRVVPGADAALAAKSVAGVDWKELASFDIGSWKSPAFAHHRVPKLTDLFLAMRGRPERRLYLDIKDASLPDLAREVAEAGVQKQVILATTHYPLILDWKQRMPEGETLLWMGTWGKNDDGILEKRFAELRANGFSGVTQLQVHAHPLLPPESICRDTPDPFTPSDAFFRKAAAELRERGILFQSLPWGGGTEAIYWKLLDLGVESFATDHPEVTFAALEHYRPHEKIPS